MYKPQSPYAVTVALTTASRQALPAVPRSQSNSLPAGWCGSYSLTVLAHKITSSRGYRNDSYLYPRYPGR